MNTFVQLLCFSDDRSPEIFRNTLEASTQMKSVLGGNEKPNCLVIDEIDGAPAVSLNSQVNYVYFLCFIYLFWCRSWLLTAT